MLRHGRVVDTDVPPQVLVVDDDESLRDMMETVLTAEGYGCGLASDGEEALALLQDHFVDVVITDLRMQNVNGLELVKRLRERYPDLGLIVLTGVDDPRIVVSLFEHGADDVIQKPSHPAVVLARLRRTLMDRHRHARRSGRFRSVRTFNDLSTRRRKSAKSDTSGKRLAAMLAEFAPVAVDGANGRAYVVRELADVIAQYHGIDPSDLPAISWAALFHDVGETLLSRDVRETPVAKRTKAQALAYREHVRIGAKLMLKIPAAVSAAEIIAQHHERYDGSGYPLQLAGNDIHIGARVLAVALAVADHLHGSLTVEGLTRAVQKLPAWSGTLADPAVVESARTALEILRRRHTGQEDVAVSIAELEPGDLLLERLVDAQGLLLAEGGAILTAANLARVRNILASDRIAMTSVTVLRSPVAAPVAV